MNATVLKHTPESWKVSHDGGIVPAGDDVCFVDGPDGNSIFGCAAENPADAHRVVACVNACAGIDDPGDIRWESEKHKHVGGQFSKVAALLRHYAVAMDDLADVLAELADMRRQRNEFLAAVEPQ